VYQDTGIYNTGASLRAFIPFGNQNLRLSLRTYSGFATVVDTRVICVRPTLHLSFEPSFDGSFDWVFMSGTVGMKTTGPKDYPFPTPSQQAFSCTIPLPGPSYPSVAGRESLIALCGVSLWKGKVQNDIDISGGEYWGFIVLRATGSYQNWVDAVSSSDNVWNNFYPEDEEEWGRLESTAAEAALSFSLCFAGFEAVETSISAWRDQNFTEPELGWISSSRRYNTSAVRRSLGAVEPRVSPAARGHLQMNRSTAEALNNAEGNNNEILDTAIWTLGANQSILMCTYCERPFSNFYDEIKDVSPALADMFNDIIVLSNRPALAIQALFTILAAMPLYDFLPSNDIKALANYTIFVEASVPTTWTGLTAVLVVIALHIVFVSMTILIFALEVKESLIGNAWAALAQVSQVARRKSYCKAQRW
jgi:hypothetical protein